jgi:8-oxo-dGTP diphosphatase
MYYQSQLYRTGYANANRHASERHDESVAGMSQRPPNQLAAFTMTLLRAGDRYLLLRRSDRKAFAPGRWTGVGGRVEAAEHDDLLAAALREIHEETGLCRPEVHNLSLRRALLQSRPGHPLTVLLYLTAEFTEQRPLTSPEGALHWLGLDDLVGLDVIDNTALVLPLLIADMERDPAGHEPVVTGAASFGPDGSLETIVWSR